MIDAETGDGPREREPSTASARPFPACGPPVWDGDRLLFAVEDGGNVHLYAVRPTAPPSPSSLIGGQRTLKGST